MNDLEIEVKFYLPDIPSVRERILELGAECKGRVFETNIRFEDASKSLMRKNSLLRLRKDATAKL
ncbi:MAG: adenylate cyclase, partial [Deltaproteobacteria bacterium]